MLSYVTLVLIVWASGGVLGEGNGGAPHIHHGVERADVWGDLWVVHVRSGFDPQLLSSELGYENLGELSGFPQHYLLKKVEHDGIEESRHLTLGLIGDLRVVWAEQQFDKLRVKRDGRWAQETNRNEADTFPYFKNKLNVDLVRRIILEDQLKSIPEELLKLWREEEALDNPGIPITKDEMFNDELWDHQWYLHDTRSLTKDLPDISLHVERVWKRGITGKGVRVVVLDDGIDHEHLDLKDNYDPDISYDLNSGDDDPAPQDIVNSHGTRCAGEIAMKANNHLCGVGVAHNATIGGIRMLDGKISDTLEGLALSYALDKVDIFSSSWGPNDDGATVEGPGRIASEALIKGTTIGRSGKGVIYVWASGNGGSHGDDCNCDGYTSSIYTLSVSSASQQGAAPWYGESCPSTLTSTYSSGAYTDQKIATTDVGGGCTVSHTGTSAAAPLAAGIIALVLEANPSLTWRDVQHLVVYTSDPGPVSRNSGWRTNGAGLQYNPRFGFGILDGDAIIEMALAWKKVPEKNTCEILGIMQKTDFRNRKANITEKDVVEVLFNASKCKINSLEHVQAVVNVEHPKRGDLEVVLVSAQGTKTRLLSPRPQDTSEKGFSDWPLMSVETWGENPAGSWQLYVVSRGQKKEHGDTVWAVGRCRLLLHGF